MICAVRTVPIGRKGSLWKILGDGDESTLEPVTLRIQGLS